MVKDIFEWEIVGDARSKTPRFMVYAVGQWDGHIMDWAGMNCRRVKVPCPKKYFTNYKDAQNWISKIDSFEEKYKGKKCITEDIIIEGIIIGRLHTDIFGSTKINIDGEGSHISDYHDDYFDAKKDVRDKMTQKEWNEFREDVKLTKENS